MTLEEYKKEVDKNINSLFEKASNEEKDLLNAMIKVINDLSQERINIIAYLKSQIKKCIEDIKELEKDGCENVANNLKIYIKAYKEILKILEKE